MFVDEEHAVGVAVEREADVGADVAATRAEVALVLGLDRVGGMVRERAVELGVQQIELDGKLLEHARDDEAAHAVRGVGDDLHRTQRADVDERVHMRDEVVEQVERRLGAPQRPVVAVGEQRRRRLP